MSAQPEKCAACNHKPSPFWECSRIECPGRKPVTASPPDDLDEGRRPAHFNDNH